MKPTHYKWDLSDEATARLVLSGSWSKRANLPRWRRWHRDIRTVMEGPKREFTLVVEDLEEWDSQLLVYLDRVLSQGRKCQVKVKTSDLPSAMRSLLEGNEKAKVTAPGRQHSSQPKGWKGMFSMVGKGTLGSFTHAREALTFLGEVLIAFPTTLRRLGGLRGLELFRAMRQCGMDAVPIVGLISFLIGMILAFQAALVLREYGADIFVANLIGLSVLREMAPLMTAIVLAGRTGAAYAAHLGNMKVSEEMDALRVSGVSPIEFLVVPRVLAMVLMTPLLVIYANALGILGGAMIANLELDIPVQGFFLQLEGAVTVMDAITGLIKSVVFALIISLTGCQRGLQCEGGSVAVGRATTSAVVTTIFLIIIADALFAVLFSILGW